MDYNPFAPDVIEDPFRAYAELRSQCPMHRFAGLEGVEGMDHPLYTATRYDDVHDLLTDVDMWSSNFGQMPIYSESGCLFSDPPVHTWYRKIVQKSFAPRHVSAMETEMNALVSQLLDEMEAKDGRADLHDALACPLPVLVIANILGVPTDDIEQFKKWSDDQLAGADNYQAADSATAMAAYLRDQVAQRRDTLRTAGIDPNEATSAVLGDVLPDNVISGLVVHEDEGRRLNDDELQVMINQLLVGGNETTTSLITNLFWRILENPQLADQIRANPALDTVAVEESLRLDAPVLGLYRTNNEALEMHGVELPKDSKVMATYAAANRDPEVFEDPDTFRLDRPAAELRKHLAFGFGHHFCPGAHLSRLETRIALRQTLDRFPDLRLDGEPQRIVPFILWGRVSVPVAWD